MFSTQLQSQCPSPVTDAGLFCSPDSPVSPAPIICSLDCLDGFAATMPDSLLENQPELLCATGGTPNNLSWFAFVAGSNLVDLTITPSNCSQEFDDDGNPILNTIGIQAGIYSSCDFESDDIIVCYGDCTSNSEDPVNLSSTDFIEGQVYYLFVDGCGGSVCDYTVTVNAGEQPFEMEEITTITNQYAYDLENDTICQGAEIAFRLDSLDLDVNFNWTISPATTEYPTGLHPVQDTNTVTFVFSDEGLFEIIVYAYNDCDASEPDTFTVYVEALEDEYFSDVVLCEECIIDGITLVSPDAGCIISDGVPLILTEDPNGDGVPGWLGISEVTSAGLDSNLVENSIGCQYTQYVNIVEIPLSDREIIDLYYCITDFPVSLGGVSFTNPGDMKNVTIENGAVSGCDSLQNITAHAIDIVGNTSIGDCDMGQVNLSFNIIDVIPADYDSITYVWYDGLGMIVDDLDNLPQELLVMNTGTYSIEVTVHKDGKSCPQTFGSISVDPDNLIPVMPTVAFSPNQICVTEGVAKIYVDNQGLGEAYIWTLVPNLPVSFGGTTDTMYVDITSGVDFQFCVNAVNGCGSSDMTCDDVIVSAGPSSEFIAPSELCIDSLLLVEYIGGDGMIGSSEFSWDFDGGFITNGANAQGGGPFQIQFPSSGSYNISMTLTEGGCESDQTVIPVNVSERFVAPPIDCESLAGTVIFSFDMTTVDGVSINVISGQNFSMIGMDTIVVDNLGTEEIVDIEILFNEEDVCGGTLVTAQCTSLPCPLVDFDISLGNQNQCIDEEDRNIELAVSIIGDDTGSGSWDSPFVYEGNLFNVLMAGPGEHLVTYNYLVSGCSFTIDTTIFLYSSPHLNFDLVQSYCEDQSNSMIDIMSESGASVTLDGDIITQFVDLEISPGNYDLIAINAEGCSTMMEVIVEDVMVDSIKIQGKQDLIKGNSYMFSSNDLGNIPDLIYIWTLDGDIICEDCNTIDLSIVQDGELCLSIIYADGCEQMDCLELRSIENNEIFVPNIFSPNGDNVNDLFTIESNGQNTMIQQIMIFDRWGEMMYTNKDVQFDNVDAHWDGQFNQKDCLPGVYVYVIRYIDIEGNIINKYGDITLVR